MIQRNEATARKWYDIGGCLSVVIVLFSFYYRTQLTHYQLLMWLSLASLFLHQFEEYRLPGTFPGMANTILFKNGIADRYPLNTNTAMIVNVFFGWTVYLAAALLPEKCVWLGLATILVSAANIVAHSFVFNIKGKTIYNAGMATCWLFFAPCTYYFFKITLTENLLTLTDYITGMLTGLAMNYLGILKTIEWMKDKNTPYIFPDKNLQPTNRENSD